MSGRSERGGIPIPTGRHDLSAHRLGDGPQSTRTAADRAGVSFLRKLEKQAASYFRDIKKSDLHEDDKDSIVEVLTSWFVQRFKTKGKKEIETMFLGELAELEETRTGQGLTRVGEERGIEKGIEKGIDRAILLLLAKKFGSVPDAIRAKVENLDLKNAETLLGRIQDWDKIDELYNWLAENG